MVRLSSQSNRGGRQIRRVWEQLVQDVGSGDTAQCPQLEINVGALLMDRVDDLCKRSSATCGCNMYDTRTNSLTFFHPAIWASF